MTGRIVRFPRFLPMAVLLLMACLGCRTLQQKQAPPRPNRAVANPECETRKAECRKREAESRIANPECGTRNPEFRTPDSEFRAETANLEPPEDLFRDDLQDFWPRLRDDALGLAKARNGLVLSAALAGAIGIHQDLDGEVREETARNPERWGKGSEILGYVGDARFQVPVLLASYAYSIRSGNNALHDLNSTLLSAYTLNAASTLAIKGLADTDRPSDDFNNGRFGFPSFHTSSSFTIAAVLEEYYGPSMGLPAYGLAGLIGWSRIDERDHDLSDVVFGAALGYVIGKSVAGRNLRGDSRVRFGPYLHPIERIPGLALDVTY